MSMVDEFLIAMAEVRKLEAENAKLRERLDEAHMSRLLTENENEALRELVWDMCEWAYSDSYCDLHGEFADRMRELGIEVDK